MHWFVLYFVVVRAKQIISQSNRELFVILIRKKLHFI